MSHCPTPLHDSVVGRRKKFAQKFKLCLPTATSLSPDVVISAEARSYSWIPGVLIGWRLQPNTISRGLCVTYTSSR